MQMLIAAVFVAWVQSRAARATIDGEWQSQTPSGSAVVLELKLDGTKLTGTLTRNGEPTPLSDGRVSVQKFNFKATVNGQVEAFSGEHVGTDLKVWMDRQGRDAALTVTRVKHADSEDWSSTTWANAS